MSKKKILVTGSAGNLGTAVCDTMIENGYHIIGTVLPGENRPVKKNAEYHEVDLSDAEKVSDFYEKLKNSHEKIDGAIALAGGFGMSNISNTGMDDMMSQFKLNFITAFNTAQNAYNWMKNTGGGSIVMVSAKPALDGGAAEVLPYAISKGAVAQFASILNETGNDDGVVTTIIAPSIIDTPPNRDAMSNANFDEWVKPSDIAKNILHILSDEGKILRKSVFRLYNKS